MYQLTVLINEKLDENGREALFDSLTQDLKNVKKNEWGIRSLTYSIKRADRAFYTHFEFETEPGKIPSLDKQLKLNEDILRYLLIRK